MLRRLRKVRRFLALPVREQLLTLEAAGWLAVARVALSTLPFRWIAARLGSGEPTGGRLRSTDRAALLRAVHNSPWAGNCLVEAVGGKLFLERRGTPSALHIGVSKSAPERALKAHAWLRVGQLAVVGGEASGYQRLHSIV